MVPLSTLHAEACNSAVSFLGGKGKHPYTFVVFSKSERFVFSGNVESDGAIAHRLAMEKADECHADAISAIRETKCPVISKGLVCADALVVETFSIEGKAIMAVYTVERVGPLIKRVDLFGMFDCSRPQPDMNNPDIGNPGDIDLNKLL